jgi:hypothetical protein
MSETMAGVVHVVFPHAAEAAADEGVASVIEVLQEHLGLAREGKLRSVAVISVSADGSAIGTQCPVRMATSQL